MTETFDTHGCTITVRPAGRGEWMYTLHHHETNLWSEGGALSKAKARDLAEQEALIIDQNKEKLKLELFGSESLENQTLPDEPPD